MSSNTLAGRIGPERAGAIKSLARRWRERDQLTFRALSDRLLDTQGVYVCPASLRAWSVQYHWADPVPSTPTTPTRSSKVPSRKQAQADAATCLRRCQTCQQVEGEGHQCRLRGRRILLVFHGGYL